MKSSERIAENCSSFAKTGDGRQQRETLNAYCLQCRRTTSTIADPLRQLVELNAFGSSTNRRSYGTGRLNVEFPEENLASQRPCIEIFNLRSSTKRLKIELKSGLQRRP